MTTGPQSCPPIGPWRAWLDQEAHAAPHMADHLATCAGCQHLVADLRAGAQMVSLLVKQLRPGEVPSAADVALARERLALRQGRRVAVSRRELRPTLLDHISTGWRIAGGGLAAALALSLVITFTPEGQTAAASFLAQFRSQRVTAVEITPQSQADIARTVNALANFGTVKMPANGARGPEFTLRGKAGQPPNPVTLAEASKQVGFALETPDPATLPAGLDRTPRILVSPGSQMRFTVDRAKANRHFQSTGYPEVTVPERLDGATLVVSIPTAAVLQYKATGSPEVLTIGQAGELVVDIEGGVSLVEMRDFLLSLPLPPAVVNQLKTINNWNQTLPIPVPVDQVNWQSATFKGQQGLLLNDNSNVFSAAIWYENGHMVGVAGSMKGADLKRIADSLAVRN